MNAQQLKNSILQEAIQGRLVPQDPTDEPASVLLERIREEKKRLVKDGKLKKKDLVVNPISEDEIPFEIPDSWEWCRVCDIADSYIGLTYKPTEVSTNGWIVLRSSNIQDGLLDYNDVVRVNIDIPEKLSVQVNDIIICARNGSKKLVGKSALVNEVNEPTTFGAFMAICRTQFFEYMAKYLLSPLFFQQLRKDSGTTTINQLTQKNFNRYLVPLPPLAEQKRIVAKIEELLPRVAEYGKAQEALDKLNAELPERLKNSILQEAIEGRLVPQDSNDEPASVLLDKIREEKKRLVKEGKLKKKDLEAPPISEDDIPFKIPESWEWVRLGAISKLIGGFAFKSHEYTPEGSRVIRISDISEEGFVNKNVVRYPYDTKLNQYVIIKNDILMAMTGGTVGKSLFVRELPEKTMLLNQRVALIRCNAVFTDYINYVLKSRYIQNIICMAKNSTNDNISMADIYNFEIPLPPLAEQKRIVAKIEEVFAEIDKLKK